MVEKVLKGIVVSDGVVIVKVYMLVDLDLLFEKIIVFDMDVEVVWLYDVFDVFKVELKVIKDKVVENLGEEEVEVFEVYIIILFDLEMFG